LAPACARHHDQAKTEPGVVGGTIKFVDRGPEGLQRGHDLIAVQRLEHDQGRLEFSAHRSRSASAAAGAGPGWCSQRLSSATAITSIGPSVSTVPLRRLLRMVSR